MTEDILVYSFFKPRFSEINEAKMRVRGISFLRCLRKFERGATAVEYALMITVIVFALIAALTFFGDFLSLALQSLGGSLAGI